ncbi:hypothetical protein [Anaerospora sp.]|jgi:hypothetical protein|uniref:hypothetical protein n=1 Tax=Anaerospora sp. TaxID=1960278 RepID=UPI00289905DE|nr:hypothetical protein [Anaerospora sp.]
MMPKEKVILSVIFVCLLGMLGVTIYNTIFSVPHLQRAEDTLQQESYRLATFPGATLTDFKIIRNNRSILISRIYTTDQHWSNLHDFYVTEAKNNDWALVIDGTISKPAEENKDLLVFNKDDFELTIAINTTKNNSSFQIDLLWSGFKRKSPLGLFPNI